MNVKGQVRDRLFTAECESVDPQRIGVMTILLEVVGDGRRMTGVISWYDVRSGRVTAAAVAWRRAGVRVEDVPFSHPEAVVLLNLIDNMSAETRSETPDPVDHPAAESAAANVVNDDSSKAH